MSSNTWYGIVAYDNEENKALPFDYPYSQPVGIVQGDDAVAQMKRQIIDMGCTPVVKKGMAPISVLNLIHKACRMRALPMDVLLAAPEQGPLCVQPGYIPSDYTARARPKDLSWIEGYPAYFSELAQMPKTDPSRTVAVFGARPADLWPSKDEKSVLMRYRRSEWWAPYDDIYSELEKFAREGELYVVTDETQGAAQLGHWAATALKREYGEVYTSVFATFEGCERAWNNQLPVFSADDFSKEVEAADWVRFIREAPEGGGNLPRSEFKTACQEKHKDMSDICGIGICATIYGTATVPALPDRPLDFAAITAGLTAAGRQEIYSIDELAAARIGVDGRIEQAQGKVNALTSEMDAAQARLDAFTEIAAQRPGGEFGNYIIEAQDKVDKIAAALGVANEELSVAKAARGDFDKIEKAALSCDMGAAMESLGAKARKRPTMAAYGEKARIRRAVPTVKLQPQHAETNRKHQV